MKTCFLILFIIAHQSFAQDNSVRSKDFIDSLFTTSGMEKTKQIYSSLTDESKNILIWKISVVDTIDALSCEDICNSFAIQKIAYDSTRIPSGISAVYDIASRYIAQDNLRDAVKLFYVAFSMKQNFIEEEKKRITTNYENAKIFYNNDNRDSVGVYYSLFETENTLSPAWRIVDRDLQLENFYSTIKNEVDRRQINDRYEQTHSELFENRFSIEIGYSAGISPNRKSPFVLVKNYYDYFDTTISPMVLTDKQTPIFAFYPTVSLSYKIENSLRLQFEFSYQEISYKNIAMRNPLVEDIAIFDSNNLKISSYQFLLSAKYLLRSNIGIRTFTELGLGVNRNSSEAKKLLELYKLIFYALEQQNTTVVLPVAMGIEYVHSKESRIFFGAKLGGNFYLTNNMYTGDFSISANLSCSVVLF